MPWLLQVKLSRGEREFALPVGVRREEGEQGVWGRWSSSLVY
jgi:hypothetical protein